MHSRKERGPVGRLLKTTALLAAAFILCGASAVSDRINAAASGIEECKKIAITFDDGPHPYYTEQLLDGLKERDVKATFFVTGMHVEQYPELIRRMCDEGDRVIMMTTPARSCHTPFRGTP